MAALLRLSRAHRLIHSAATLAATVPCQQAAWAQQHQPVALHALPAAWHAAASWESWRCFASSKAKAKKKAHKQSSQVHGPAAAQKLPMPPPQPAKQQQQQQHHHHHGKPHVTQTSNNVSNQRTSMPAALQAAAHAAESRQNGLRDVTNHGTEHSTDAVTQQGSHKEAAMLSAKGSADSTAAGAAPPPHAAASGAAASDAAETACTAAKATDGAKAADSSEQQHSEQQESEKHDLVIAMEKAGSGMKPAKYAYETAIEHLSSSPFLALEPLRVGPLRWAFFLLRRWLARPMQRFAHTISVEIMRDEIETEFDADAFLDGCKAAAHQVVKLYGLQDWKALRGMVSQALLRDMQERHAEAAQAGFKATSMQLLEPRAFILLTALWTRQMVAHFDSERAAEQLQPGQVPYWVVVGVEVHAHIAVELDRVASGSDGDDDFVNLPLKSRSFRRATLLFARGPLPKSKVPQLDSEWFLLGWV